MGRISVVKESDTGRNQRFVDNKTHKEMNRIEFVSAIRNGQYQDYYVFEYLQKRKLPALEIYVLQLLYPTVVLQELKPKLFV